MHIVRSLFARGLRGGLAVYAILGLSIATPSAAVAEMSCVYAPNPNCQLCGAGGCFVVCDPAPNGTWEWCNACGATPVGNTCG